jgi:hypothetical protein
MRGKQPSPGTDTASIRRGAYSSDTAIAAARSYFPDIEWIRAPASEYLENAEPVDLTVARELLSYVEDWREVLALCERARYLLVSLFLPPDPIGFVKSPDELRGVIERHFRVLESVDLLERRLVSHLCESLAPPPRRS